MTSSEYGPTWLAEVRLEKFKAAFDPGPIPLRPFNIIIGRNGSGKSTLLEALQWVATTIRRDAREACDRYFGIGDLVNLRSQTLVPYFRLTLTWAHEDAYESRLRYRLKVANQDDTPVIIEEDLATLQDSGRVSRQFIRSPREGERLVNTGGQLVGSTLSVREPDRLALGVLGATETAMTEPWLAFLADYWARAVFLRLSPNRLANGSPARRKSFEPLLDEEGQSLPALLSELDTAQRVELIRNLRDVLPGIRGVQVSSAENGRDTRVNYSLQEQMPYRGRAGRSQFSIPAWMLSEGTRRITAILALLVREPAPSLLCVEEIENGLDPWTVLHMLNHLQSATDAGTQVLVTTHSPWFLDHVPIESITQVRRIGGDTRYEQFSDRAEIRDYQANVPAGTRYVQEEA